MDSGHPGARPEPNPESKPKTLPVLTTAKYPKPPGLLYRFLFLCLKPEAWAAAARYPFRVTLFPLLLAILIASLITGIASSEKAIRAFTSFAQSYDANYPKIFITSDGVVSVSDTTKLPANFFASGMHLVIDTTGKTTIDSLKDPTVAVVTDRMVYRRFNGSDLNPTKVSDALQSVWFYGLLPEPGKITTIDSANILDKIHRESPFLPVATTFLILLGQLLWTAITLFLISPAVSIGAALGKTRLFIPRRPGYRIAAAILVPIVLFSGIIDATGYSLTSTIGPQNNLLVWFFASAALALWAGILAKQMYLPKPKLKPRRTT